MKTKLIVLLNVVALSCLAAPPLSDQLSDDDKVSRDRDEALMHRIQHLGDLRRMNQIVDEEVKDDHGQKIGKVKDLALDLQNGRIVAVILATGGTLGMDERIVAVPPEKFECDHTMKALRLNVDKAQLSGAPEFKTAQWREATEDARILETYQRFGVEPYFTRAQPLPPSAADLLNSRGQVSKYYSFNPQNALPRLGVVARATRLAGTTVWSEQNEKLGKVDTFVMDLPAGRLVEVVLAEGGFLGIHRELSAVPPQSFHWNGDNTALTLNATTAEFRAAPHFKSSEWGYAVEPASVASVYESYHVWPYFGSPEMDSGAVNVRERIGETSPIERGNSADMDTSERIRKAIQSNEGFSANARDIKIITVDGKVTLMGPVDSAEEKKLIGETAAKIVSADKVDNQLEVHTGLLPENPSPANVPK